MNCNDIRRSRRVEPIYDEPNEFLLQQESSDSVQSCIRTGCTYSMRRCMHDYDWITDPGSVIDSPTLSQLLAGCSVTQMRV